MLYLCNKTQFAYYGIKKTFDDQDVFFFILTKFFVSFRTVL